MGIRFTSNLIILKKYLLGTASILEITMVPYLFPSVMSPTWQSILQQLLASGDVSQCPIVGDNGRQHLTNTVKKIKANLCLFWLFERPFSYICFCLVFPNRDLRSYLYSYFCIPFQLIRGLSVLLIQLGNLWFLVEFLEKTHKQPLLMFEHCEYQLFSLIATEGLLMQVSHCHLWNVVTALENVEAALSHWRLKAARSRL